MPKKTLRVPIFAALLIFIFAVVWAFLSLFHSPYADWLTVEAPRYADVGTPLSVRITLGTVPEPSVLMADLYLLGKNHLSIGSIPSLDHSPAVKSGGSYSFKFDLQEMEKLALVQLVIYVSPTGRWRTRTHGASTEAIPVRRPNGRDANPDFKKIKLFAIRSSLNPETPFVPGGRPPEPEVFRDSPSLVRIALLALIISGGLACAANADRRRPARLRLPGPGGEWRLWAVSAAVLFLAAFGEAFHVGGRLSEWGRRIIVGMDLYYARQSYQRPLLALIAAVTSGLLLLAVRAVKRKRVRPHIIAVGAVLALYLAGSFAGAISFHYLDILRGVTLTGVSVIDTGKMACAAAILILSLAALKADKT
jgi:hypothetical protein